jgi:lysophospholipase L1-like esterase
MARVSDYIRHGVLDVAQYQLVILHFATNDLTTRVHFTTCADRIVAGLDRAIQAIYLRNPGVRIAVSGILPRLIDHHHENWNMINARIYSNVAMRDFCDNRGIYYLTSETFLKGFDPIEDMFRKEDGIHLSYYGSYYFQSYMEGKVGELLGPSPRLHQPIAMW